MFDESTRSSRNCVPAAGRFFNTAGPIPGPDGYPDRDLRRATVCRHQQIIA